MASSPLLSFVPETRHQRLITAAAHANETLVRAILAEQPSWTAPADHDALRQALQRVSGRGRLSIVRLLIEQGAAVNPKSDAEVPAIVKAAESGNVAVVSELISHHVDVNARNRLGQTALFVASVKGHNRVVEILLNSQADANAKDKEGRTPLLYLASEKQPKAKWTLETLRLLHQHGALIDAFDQIGRTPLLWAATNSNVELAQFLLENHAYVATTNNRGRTALHLSAESNDKEHRDDMVRLLLKYGADPDATSDGGWTPLHNAAQNGYLSVATLLLDANANVNAELSNGMTPLHWAAFNGFEEFVLLLLSRHDVNISVKDSFDRTPMLCAAEKFHANIVRLLSPALTASRLTALEEGACKAFEATVVDFGQFEKKQLVSKYSVYDLLYGWNDETNRPQVSTLTKNLHYKPDFRWIHLPANNIAWVETLLAKSFIEAGHRDIESFKALEKCFDQEHRGPLAHAHFMRPFCHRIPSPRRDEPDVKKESPLPSIIEFPLTPTAKSGQGDNTPGPVNPSDDQDVSTSEPEVKKKRKSKSEQTAERHPKKHSRGKGPPSIPHTRQDIIPISESRKNSFSLPWDTPTHAASHGKIVLFMPFLHYETDKKRRQMSRAIKCAHEGTVQTLINKDTMLLDAYLKSNPPLHPRRTLDQFFYHGVDTSVRDTDQVVYRFCKRHKIEPKVFMVDQLWLWVLGKELVITCFPQRWKQPKNDPLNVLDGIIEETNAKTRPPIQSVYDLAMLITSRCSGMFDRSRLGNQDYQFLDMFESSIGLITDRESRLFSRFNRASAQSARWLRQHRRRNPDQPDSDEPSELDHDGEDDGPGFLDTLLDIGGETSLLAEIKDIRDELTIIKTILETQLQTMTYLEGFITEELRSKSSRRSTEAVVSEVKRRTGEQKRGLEAKVKDVARMDKQAETLYNSLTDLLDLKQKHGNALEARFAGDQALIAARQGQTVMVFTIVTIVFLPLSFIASFFTINFEEWQKNSPLTFGYVSKYVFGIGLGISIPLIALAFTFQSISSGFMNLVSLARGRLEQTTSRDRGDTGAVDPVAHLRSLGMEKTDFSKNPFRRDDLYQPPPSRRDDRSISAWIRPSFQTARRSEDYYGRASPVHGLENHQTRSPVSGNIVTWATEPTFMRGEASGSRARGPSQDLESGRFRLR